MSKDALVPHFTSAEFHRAPGGEMALKMAEEFGVTAKYAKDRHRRWLQWAKFCALGDGLGNEYELYSVSQSKWRLFAGWLADGVSEDKDLNQWRSAINHYFAEAEKGRPLRGFDINKVIRGHGRLLVKRKKAAGVELEEFRVGCTKLHVIYLCNIGLVVSGKLLSIVALLLNMSVFGYRGATAGGYQDGDAYWGTDEILVFFFRAVKMRPELRYKPVGRTRTMPSSSSHPMRRALVVIRRAMRCDPDALGVAARECGSEPSWTAAQCEAKTAPLITKWMRSILGDGMGVAADMYISAHSWRIMLAAACQAIKCDLDYVCVECFWKNRDSMDPYLVRKYQYDHFWEQYYDFLLPRARR